ncbi:hypothetical protein HDV64DRAFT_262087 [Trichoderma sp. TUCIM 5745]
MLCYLNHEKRKRASYSAHTVAMLLFLLLALRLCNTLGTSDKQRSPSRQQLACRLSVSMRMRGRLFCLLVLCCCWPLLVTCGLPHLCTARQLPAAVTSRRLTTALR